MADVTMEELMKFTLLPGDRAERAAVLALADPERVMDR